jgi:hypothetical protein
LGIPFSTGAKRTLEETLHRALDRGDRHIGAEHLVLALPQVPGPVRDILEQEGVTGVSLRDALRTTAS